MSDEKIPSKRVFSIFNGGSDNENLSRLVSELFAEQRSTWRELNDGYKSLETVREREVKCDGYSVRLRHNSLRAKSTTAAVDKESIMERSCFLCSSNLPEDQKGILYRNRYLILCNPMPVFHSHLTIAALEHRPQRIEGNIDMLFQLMDDLGSKWTILYNGPECGASAPDHHHFQAIPSGFLPVEYEKRLITMTSSDGIDVCRADNIGREVIVLKGENLPALRSALHNIVMLMRGVFGPGKEHMMNIAGIVNDKERQLFIFPRSKHRPEAFFREGDERIVVSPAIIEMCGIIITPVERDFQRLIAHDIQSIYQEVSQKIDPDKFIYSAILQ